MTRIKKAFVMVITAIVLMLSVQPVYAETKEIPITNVSFPTTITIKEGETKVLDMQAEPYETTYKTNIEWGSQTNEAFTVKANGYGTYWDQPSSEVITGVKAGKGYLFNTVKMYDSNKAFIKKYTARATVIVVADESEKETPKTTNPETTQKPTTQKPTTQKPTTQKPVAQKPAVPTEVPLKSISFTRTNATVTVGETITLVVNYSPSNTTEKKSITWKSSNAAVASVNGRRVTAKKAGTATITAKMGSKTASCVITVKAKQTKNNTVKEGYKDVSEAYKLLNSFRTTKSNQWYWNRNNTKKVSVTGLKALSKDATLEKVAKTRAKEQWTQYYKNGKATHTRPNGQSWDTAYPAGLKAMAENLAWGQNTCKTVILDPSEGWAETNYKYSGQGHRRNMLDKSFTKVGIACYEKDGKTCWAMSLGK